MPRAYSDDFRGRIAALYDEGYETAEVCDVMGCCPAFARRLMQRRRATGSIAPLIPTRPDRRAYDDADEQTIRDLIRRQPDATLAEVVAALGKPVHLSTAGRTLARLGLPRKKKSTHASEQDRPDVKAQRDAWFEQFAAVRVSDLVFVDEFGATTQMQRTHGRAAPGERVISTVPHGHYQAVSTVAAMTVAGIVAAATFTGATDTDLFVAFVRDELAPTLRTGHVVVMDNLAPHKYATVRTLIEGAGARLILLPPYSPDFNPIEQAISKIKTVLRKLARRDVPALFEAIGEALRTITPTDALHFMLYRGYTLQ